jgi:hypothetical protein
MLSQPSLVLARALLRHLVPIEAGLARIRIRIRIRRRLLDKPPRQRTLLQLVPLSPRVLRRV